MAIRVLVVDDENMVRTVLRAVIDAEPDMTVVGEAADGTEVLPLVTRLRPDVVLMDVRMPSQDGITTTRALTENVPEPPRVVVLTIFESDGYVYDALRAGAAAFLLKRAQPAEIVHAVRVAARGESVLFPASIRALAAAHVGARRTGRLVDAHLTDREVDVLRLMTEGLSNSEIAARLYVTVGTVKTHVASLLTKLRVRDRTQAVIAAYESGFVDPG